MFDKDNLIPILPTYKETLKQSNMSDIDLKEYLLRYIEHQQEIIGNYKLKDVDIFPIRWMRSQSFIFISLISLILLTLYIAHSNLISTGIPEEITYIAITTLELCSLTFLANNKKYPNYIFILLTFISSGMYFKAWNYDSVDAVIRSFYTITPSLAMFFLSKLIFERYDRKDY
jgi:hypothetical protein